VTLPRLRQCLRHTLAVTLAACAILQSSACVTEPEDPDDATSGVDLQPLPPPQPTSQAAPLSPDQLNQLVAPIALYPDQLVAQILAAATSPAEIVEADRWLQANSTLKGEALGKAVDPQPWDSSVKALTQFPEVLAMMDRDLAWTSALGEAYMNDSQAVMDSVQRLRQRAEQAGNLQSNSQQTVSAEGSAIEIEPAEADVVYIPVYDPWLAYGTAIFAYPDWFYYPGLYIDGPGIVWGLGIGIGVFGGFGWGWPHWGCDWPGHGLFFNHAPYVPRSPTFWGRRDGFAPRAPSGDFGRSGSDFRPAAEPDSGGGFRPGGFNGASGAGGVRSGTRSGAFSGFGHGGVARGFSARGASSFGGGHAAGGGFHGGGHR
jgi:hypothetical protein